MKHALFFIVPAVLVAGLAFTFIGNSTADAAGRPSLERGHYLVQTIACTDCHTPWIIGERGPEPDASRFLTGHPADLVMPAGPVLEGPWVTAVSGTNTAWYGPWGISFTANLTPDSETGLGLWSVDDFIATIRNARRQGRGRELLPPMPAHAYRNLTDADLASIFMYLQSLPPTRNRVPDPRPPVGAN